MLEKLEQIGWKDLDASDVPNWLRNLTSPDRKTRNSAFKKLERYLVPWEALELCSYEPKQLLGLIRRDTIVLVVPFLIELLGIETIQDKELLLLLLDELLGYKNGEVCLEKPQLEEYRLYLGRIHNAILEGSKLYQNLAKSSTFDIRRGAAELLESLEHNSTS
jgi:hypothetical protein